MAKKVTKQFRPSIVTFMGHIDHGKTTLLDKIRSTNLWKKETGGITQHIGAYQVNLKTKKGQDTFITFIDTPGHAAFVNMRRTGSQVTDLVVLVISATDGIKAQTKECIKLIQKQKLPFIVAINKIDQKNASVDKVKGQLVELEITPEDYGGQVCCLPVSAKTGQGIDKLLEMIVLNAEIMELISLPQAPLQAFIIESKIDKNRGPVASLILKQGSIEVGDIIYIQNQPTKIKALINYNGDHIQQIGPGGAVEVLGFDSPPPVASQVTDHLSPSVADGSTDTPTAPPSAEGTPHPEGYREAAGLPAVEGTPLEPTASIGATPSDSDKQLLIIIKADTYGTLRAMLKSFSDDVLLIHSGIGAVNENDIFLAESSGAQIFAFNLKIAKFIKNLAKNQKVRIFESNIIYEIIDDINAQVLKILEPTIDETMAGEAKIIAQLEINKRRIAGVKCTKGLLCRGDTIHLKRGEEIIKDSKIDTVRQGKQEVDEVKTGAECGVTFKPQIDFHLDDVIISYYKTKE